MECTLDVKFAEVGLVKLSMLSAGCMPGDMLRSWGVVANVLSSSDHLLLSLFLLFFIVHLLVPFFFLCLFFVYLCYPALLYVVQVPHTFPPCEISCGRYGEFRTSLILGFYACMLHWVQTKCFTKCLYSSSAFCFFPICFHAQCSINNPQISFQLYQACIKLYLNAACIVLIFVLLIIG